MGVRGRLLLAFLGISVFSLVAAASGVYSLSQVGGELRKITEHRVPEALSWLELSRRVESIVRAAPALLVVNTDTERIEVSNEITSQIEQLEPILQRDRMYETGEEQAAAAEVARLVAEMTENLASLDELVKTRLSIVEHREKLTRQLATANSVAQRTLTAGARVLDAQIADWNRDREEVDVEQLTREDSNLASSIIGLIPQQQAAALVDAVDNNLLNITDADSAERIDVLMFPLKKSLQELVEISQDIPRRARSRLEKQIEVIEGLVTGPNSLAEVRKNELAVVDRAEELLAVNVRLSNLLTNRVNFLVESANSAMEAANSQAAAVQTLSRNILIGIVVLSIVSSFLIVWLYVGRNLIARLTALSGSMMAIADGNLEAAIPSAANDEIGDMAKALVVFRDTAVEVKKSNLREISEARRRLTDAIESISEGFSLFDADDRLVVSNSTYRKLLYPGIEDVVVPGVSFEQIVREAAERGLIADAHGRVEEWVAERVARHRDAGEPHLQRRSDGRWILISERKTEDGGTVAVYADITEIKRHEEELSEKSEALEQKSNALEQLSNQLAKYLSPQVYDSIFSGRQEVKVASSRKKLTVFFSDIAGFTETADKLESEDLTQLLNHYLTEMSRIALAYGATIDKYVGDAIVIFFGDPETRGVKEDALACVEMAIAMRKRLAQLEGVWRDAGIDSPLRCRIGINTGYCTVGNFGSEDRMDYTIVGGGVNLASRLESAAQPGEILISYETWAHVRERVHCEERGPITVKGIAYPVATYRVVDSYEDLGRQRRHFREVQPNAVVDLNLEAMTTSDRRHTATVLQRALSLLSNGDDAIRPQAEARIRLAHEREKPPDRSSTTAARKPKARSRSRSGG